MFFILMGLFNRLFDSEEVVKEIKLADDEVLGLWRNYFRYTYRKKLVIASLSVDNLEDPANELKDLLKSELFDIESEEVDEAKIIKDLTEFARLKRIKRVEQLESRLNYVKSRGEYLYQLLDKLHEVLKNQLKIVELLLNVSRDAHALIVNLQAEFQIEEAIIENIKKVPSFNKFFLSLMRGETIIKKLNIREKVLLRRLKHIQDILMSEGLDKGAVNEWVNAIFNGMEDKIHELSATGELDYHPNLDFEFVNGPEFPSFVRETIDTIKFRRIKDRTVEVFIHLFREWYNYDYSADR